MRARKGEIPGIFDPIFMERCKNDQGAFNERARPLDCVPGSHIRENHLQDMDEAGCLYRTDVVLRFARSLPCSGHPSAGKKDDKDGFAE